jgi:hypothetical protein
MLLSKLKACLNTSSGDIMLYRHRIEILLIDIEAITMVVTADDISTTIGRYLCNIEAE